MKHTHYKGFTFTWNRAQRRVTVWADGKRVYTAPSYEAAQTWCDDKVEGIPIRVTFEEMIEDWGISDGS